MILHTTLPNTAMRLLLAWLCLMALPACQSFQNTDQPKSIAYHQGQFEHSRLSSYFTRPEGTPATDSGFYPLQRGHDALLIRLAMIEAAQQTLDLQYYIFRDDETSQLLIWRLYQAAERGVRVRLLLDDMQNRNDDDIAYLNGHPNIEIRLFNPHQYRWLRVLSWVSDGERLNRRMHNKSLTADGVLSVIGGRNIGNEYFSFQSDVEFGDFDLLLNGPVVLDVANQFDLYWNSEFSIPMTWIQTNEHRPNQQDIDAWLERSQIEHKFTSSSYNFTELPMYQALIDKRLALNWGAAELLYDLPDKINTGSSLLIDGLAPLLADIEHSAIIVSPYFVPTESGTKALTDAARQGKKITIVTNSLASNDVFAVHGWYAKYREALLRGGVELWEIKSHAHMEHSWSVTGSSRSSLHAKVMLLDQRKLFVGSMNMDPRSATLNTELAVVFEQPTYTQQAEQTLLKQLPESAYKLMLVDDELIWQDLNRGETHYCEPEAGWLLRSGAWLSGILPIEDWL